MKLRVASYNIRHGHDAGLDMAVLAKDILSAAPDVVGLQEVDVRTERVQGRDTLAELAAAAGFAHYAFCRAIPFAGGEYGTAILSRYPIRSFAVIPLPCTGAREMRAVGQAVLDADGERVDVFNTHLSYESHALRLPQFEALAALTAPHPAWIPTGDFNTADTGCFAAFAGACLANPGTYPTFPGTGEGIDNIVCSSPWRIADTGVLPHSHSDHLLLWAELTK